MKEENNKRNNVLFLVLLGLIILFHFVNNISYLSLDTRPPAWDESWHTAISFSYYNQLTGNEMSLNKFTPATYERSTWYPHLVHYSAVPFYALLGVHEDVAAFTITFYLAILIIFTYLIGKLLYNPKVGLVAALIVSLYQIVFGTSRLFLLDLPVTAFVVMTFYFIFRYLETKKNIDLCFIVLSTILGFFLILSAKI